MANVAAAKKVTLVLTMRCEIPLDNKWLAVWIAENVEAHGTLAPGAAGVSLEDVFGPLNWVESAIVEGA